MWPFKKPKNKSPDRKFFAITSEIAELRKRVCTLEDQNTALIHEIRNFKDTPIRLSAIHTKYLGLKRDMIAFEKRQERERDKRRHILKQILESGI